jgi:hypothetical protein
MRAERFGKGRQGLLLGLCAALGAWLVLGLLVFAAQALADPYVPPSGGATEPPLEGLGSCPTGPAEPYEGEDHAAIELRLLRTELAESCAALAGRTDEVSHRVWWVVAEAVQAQEQRVLANTLASETRDRLAPPVPVSVDDWTYELPLDTEDVSSAESSADVVSAVDATGTALKEALWFLSGLLVMLAGSALYRHLKP